MIEFLSEFTNFTPIDLFDILLVWLLIHYLLSSIWKTTALPVILGIIIITFLTITATYLNLQTFSFLLSKISNILLIAIVILFPAEVRKALYQLGQIIPKYKKNIIKVDDLDIIASSAKQLGNENIGALMIFKNKDSLLDIKASGQKLEAELSIGLIYSIFHKNSPLHDGAIVIEDNKISSAACYIPTLSRSKDVDISYGTRHRAALSLSTQSDAVILIISEERGTISVAFKGEIFSDLDRHSLKEIIQESLKK